MTRKRPRSSIAETILSLETTAVSKTTWKRLVLISKSYSSIPVSSSRTVPISVGHPIHKTPSLITIPSTSNVTTNNFFSSILDVWQHWNSIDRHNIWDKRKRSDLYFSFIYSSISQHLTIYTSKQHSDRGGLRIWTHLHCDHLQNDLYGFLKK